MTYEEIELIKESVCDGCKGLFWLHETECYKNCEDFQDEYKQYEGAIEFLYGGEDENRIKRY